jgi:lipopolysaccharide export system permease protein
LSILFKYILKRLLASFIIIAPVIIVVVWLTISIRYINLIITDDIKFSMFCRLILCTLPEIASTISPVCFLISGMYVFHRMRNDQEIVIMMTSRKSIFSIATPLMFFALILSVVMYYAQANLTPMSHKNLIDISQKVRNQVSMSIVKPGVFNILGSSVVYIGSKTNTSLFDVFISYIPKKTPFKTNIISAKSGTYEINNNRLYITLKNGNRQVLDAQNRLLSILKFERFSFEVTDFVKRYSSKSERPHEKTQKELFEEAKRTSNNKLKMQYLSEAHGRHIISVLPILNALLISWFLIVASSRERRWHGLLKCFTGGVVGQICVISLVNMSGKIENLLFYNYAIVMLLVYILIYFSFLKKNKR